MKPKQRFYSHDEYKWGMAESLSKTSQVLSLYRNSHISYYAKKYVDECKPMDFSKLIKSILELEGYSVSLKKGYEGIIKAINSFEPFGYSGSDYLFTSTSECEEDNQQVISFSYNIDDFKKTLCAVIETADKHIDVFENDISLIMRWLDRALFLGDINEEDDYFLQSECLEFIIKISDSLFDVLDKLCDVDQNFYDTVEAYKPLSDYVYIKKGE